jgi:hypothetical protein
MRLMLIAAAGMALSGCMLWDADKGLKLYADKESPREISERFHAAAAKQWGARPGMKEATRGAQEAGFACQKLMPESMPVVSQSVTSCRLVRQQGACSDVWTIEMRFAALSRDLDPVRVSPDGKFERTCAG